MTPDERFKRRRVSRHAREYSRRLGLKTYLGSECRRCSRERRFVANAACCYCNTLDSELLRARKLEEATSKS